MKARVSKLRVLFLDIEATNLSANFGYCLCIAYKWEGQKVIKCISIDRSPTFKKDCTNDKWVIEQIAPVLAEADIIVGHYHERFDLPFLQTRAAFHGLPPLETRKTIDTWRIARKRLKLNSNRLASLAALLGVSEKTPLSGPIWIKAMAGHKQSIKYVCQHCIQDVIVLEEVYHKIKALRPDNPKYDVEGGCPTCGSSDIQSRGRIRTVKRAMRRYHCQSCGHWFSRAISGKESKET